MFIFPFVLQVNYFSHIYTVTMATTIIQTTGCNDHGLATRSGKYVSTLTKATFRQLICDTVSSLTERI